MPRLPWRLLVLGQFVLFSQSGWALEPGWEKLEGCHFVQGTDDDGDRVGVQVGDAFYTFRLYFIDCVEDSPTAGKRRAGQMKGFEVTGEGTEEAGLQVAAAAAKFTAEQLRQPFTVYTRWQKVSSKGKDPSMRAFIETANGADLGELLVGEGLALIREGKASSARPDGKTASQIVRELREAETKARLARKGAWAFSVQQPPVVNVEPGAELPAKDRLSLVSSAGKPVRVRGRVSKISALEDGRIVFLDFEGAPEQGFVAIIREDFQPAFRTRYPEGLEKALVGKEVTIDGVVTLYRETPQIELERTTQLTILPEQK